MKLSRILNTIFLITLSIALISFPTINAIAAEKELPSQSELDSCFAGDFNLVDQITKTYSDSELEGLDRALSAMNMNRHDMDFRKDYTDGILAFPIILDMMKHPLHIAPYMDGYVNSIDALKNNEWHALPEILASAMLHPAIEYEKLPSSDDLRAWIHGQPHEWTDMSPSPSDEFTPILLSIAIAEQHTQLALNNLEDDELKILRQKIPQVITWHDVFKSPYSPEEKERLNKIVEDFDSDSYVDELATKVDLQEMMAAYLCLPNPYNLSENIKSGYYPSDEPEYYETPWGRMAIGTLNNDYYTGDFAILIEPGGDDVYENCRIGAAFGTSDKSVGYFLDMSGDDKYFCTDVNITLGASIMGVGAFYDLGGGDDLYKGGNMSLGSATCGIASFLDDGGSDEYFTKVYGQGAAGYGIGVMVDQAPPLLDTDESPANKEEEEIDESLVENDRYEAWLMAQGFSRQWGIGLCHGSRSNDTYHAGGVYLHAPLFNDRYQSFSQGFSIGSRDIDYAGGIAFLLDEGGNDYYLGDIYNQGVGYWYSGGFLYDRAGNDHYEMTQYGQGSGIHLAVGGVIDNSGNDSYTMNSGLGQGGSHDFAASVMMDRGGNDRYIGSTSCNGSGLTNAVGLFFDRAGNDIYGVDPNASTLGGGRWARDTGSIGIFVDTDGDDFYVGKGHDNKLWTQSLFGAGVDFKKEDLAQAESSEPVIPEAKKEIKIPEICSYEGEFTDEVFDELWAIAVRWEVGDNSVIVPKARERLIAFGAIVIPKIDEEFDDTYGLAFRAYQTMLPTLYENYPDEIRAMLIKNLDDPSEDRNRNAISMIAELKIIDLDERLVHFLDIEKLRGTAIDALGTIGSNAGNEKIMELLAPDNEERLILRAAKTLLQLEKFDIYPELRVLLDHEYFTVREGIIELIAKNETHFRPHVYRDLRDNKINQRTRISLLEITAKFPDFFPSRVLFDEVCSDLNHDDWVNRAHAVSVLKHWLTFESEQWQILQEDITQKLEQLKETEDDFHVLFLLNDK